MSSAKFLCPHNGDKIFSFIQELNFYKLIRLISDFTELIVSSFYIYLIFLLTFMPKVTLFSSLCCLTSLDELLCL